MKNSRFTEAQIIYSVRIFTYNIITDCALLSNTTRLSGTFFVNGGVISFSARM